MHTIIGSTSFLNLAALQAAIVASLGAKFIGVNSAQDANRVPITWTPGNPPVQNNGTCYLIMDDTAQPSDDATAQSLATAHDPVFLSVDRASIPSDNTTPATVTVRAPKVGAAAVTLSISAPGGQTVTQLVTMVAGVGTVAITSPISGAINVSVQNPSNRSADTITIQAV